MHAHPCETAEALEEALARNPADVKALTLSYEPLRLLGRSSEARRRNALALELDSTNPLALERHLAAKARRAGGRLPPDDSAWCAVERLARTRASARSLLSFIRVCGGDLAGVGEMAAFVAERPRRLPARIEHVCHWGLRGPEICAELSEDNPVRMHILRSWMQAELGCAATPSAGLVNIAQSFRLVEERRLLVAHISEM